METTPTVSAAPGAFLAAAAISPAATEDVQLRQDPPCSRAKLPIVRGSARRRSSDLIMSFRLRRKPKLMFSLFQMGFFPPFLFSAAHQPFPTSHSILIGLKLLRLPLLWSSFILIATAHCRLCPYVIAAQQMDQNAPRNLPRYY